MPDIKEIIEQLKLQRNILKGGGYGRSVRTPWKSMELFRDSLTCLNFDEVVKKHPCSECLLWDYVPEEHRDDDIPCHSIPLNQHGDSITTLEDAAERDRAEQVLMDWLDTTIADLEKKLAEQQRPGA
ncbi:MAG TPA: hypothetical protein VMO17_15110 [Terriglobia bacterium]|nr:hypothetical protein [Terriglobia bacterium]